MTNQHTHETKGLGADAPQKTIRFTVEQAAAVEELRRKYRLGSFSVALRAAVARPKFIKAADLKAVIATFEQDEDAW